MGRYYSGDINGKFWFAVQSSNAASRFGGYEYCPSTIEYEFEERHLPEVEEELKNIENQLGNMLPVIRDFFERNNGYNDDMLKYNIPAISKVDVSLFADYELGIKIRDCIKDTGICVFSAEI